MLRLVHAYDSALRRRPLLVKALTSGAINATADVCIQRMTTPESPWDRRRTLVYGGVYGLCAALGIPTPTPKWLLRTPTQSWTTLTSGGST